MKKWLIGIVTLMLAVGAWAEVRVVATVPNLGMLAREIGGDAVTVKVLAPPNRDVHYLEARPSMMAALRRADLVVSVGAELEIGWLPAAIQGANNRDILPGRPGYFEAARQVKLLWDEKPADRSLGDVHPGGNPHIYLDPERMAQVGRALAVRLADSQPEEADKFQANAERFAGMIAEKTPGWRERADGAKGVVAYHADADYLLHYLDVPLLGHIEPLPGIPPTAAHLRDLVQQMRGREGVIWSMEFDPQRPGEFLANQLGWDSYHLPSQVGMKAEAEEYLSMIDAWVRSVE